MTLKNQCIIIWIEGCLQDSFNNNTLNHNHQTLNKIVEDGCVGQLLILNNDDSTHNQSTTVSEFNQLLGFEINEDSTHELFIKKFNNLKLKIYTNDKSFNDHYLQKDFNIKYLGDVNNDSSNKVANEICSNNDDEMLILHLNKSTLESANQIVQLIQNSDKNKDGQYYYINLLANYNNTSVVITSSQNSSSSSNAPAWFVPPIQSYQTYDGKILEPRMTSPWFAIYYHPIWTRKDKCQFFSDSEFIKGSNGKILLIQYLKDLAFKLGRIPKYGA